MHNDQATPFTFSACVSETMSSYVMINYLAFRKHITPKSAEPFLTSV
jgi:hypothetical protein